MGKGEAPAPREPEEEDTGGVVKLISAEGFEFVVDKKAAMVSNTLRNMLTSPGTFRCFSFPFVSIRPPLIFLHPLDAMIQAASPRRARARSASRRSLPTSSRRSASTSTGRSITPGYKLLLGSFCKHPDSLGCARLLACARYWKSPPVNCHDLLMAYCCCALAFTPWSIPLMVINHLVNNLPIPLCYVPLSPIFVILCNPSLTDCLTKISKFPEIMVCDVVTYWFSP